MNFIRTENQALSQFKLSLDCLVTGVIIADNHRDIIYINPSAIRLLHEYESDIRQKIPHFNPTDLIWQNIDLFPKNPA